MGTASERLSNTVVAQDDRLQVVSLTDASSTGKAIDNPIVADARKLAGEGSAEAVAAMLRLLTNAPSEEVAAGVLDAFSVIGNVASMQSLWETLRTATDPSVIRACQLALANLAGSGFAASAPGLLEGTSSYEEQNRLLVALSMASSPAAITALAKMGKTYIEHASGELAVAASYALAHIGTPAAERALLELVLTPGFPADATDAIAHVQTSESLSSISQLATGNATNVAASVRVNAIRALGNYPSASTLQTLNRIATQDSSEDARKAANEVIALLSK